MLKKKSLYFAPDKWSPKIGMSVQTVDASMLVRVPEGQEGRMLGLPNRAGSPRGALVEVGVSGTWCWSLQLFPPDRAVGQCHCDSTPSFPDEQ